MTSDVNYDFRTRHRRMTWRVVTNWLSDSNFWHELLDSLLEYDFWTRYWMKTPADLLTLRICLMVCAIIRLEAGGSFWAVTKTCPEERPPTPPLSVALLLAVNPFVKLLWGRAPHESKGQQSSTGRPRPPDPSEAHWCSLKNSQNYRSALILWRVHLIRDY